MRQVVSQSDCANTHNAMKELVERPTNPGITAQRLIDLDSIAEYIGTGQLKMQGLLVSESLGRTKGSGHTTSTPLALKRLLH
jgi:hypothetical protein